jgi:pyruvate dehydrogenase E2 component (dihydrolipoamide acetyltransferase)
VIEFRLVDIGEGLTEAEIVRWLVSVGDQVREDEPVVEIETDKAVVEMPAPATGTVVTLGGEPGDVITVGDVLVVIDDGSAADDVPPMATRPAPPTHGSPTPPPSSGPAGAMAVTPEPSAPADARPLATPSTRGLARRLGVDISVVSGSGPGGRITDDDVTAAASPTPTAASAPADAPAPKAAAEPASGADRPAAAAGTRIALRGVRKRTAENMTEAWRAVPHVDSFHEVDVTDLFALREQHNAIAGRTSVTMTALFVKATALALVEHPMLNASIDLGAGEIVLHDHVHIGVAVDTSDGLVLPVVRDAGTRTLADIATELTRLGESARARRLAPAEMSGATFTVSNHGVFGGWFGTSLVHGSEVGIAGFGPARRRPEFDGDGRVVARQVLVVNLAADHRVVDGRDIIRFGTAIRERLEAPLALFLDGA